MLDLRLSTYTSEIKALHSNLEELSLICGARDNSGSAPISVGVGMSPLKSMGTLFCVNVPTPDSTCASLVYSKKSTFCQHFDIYISDSP